MLLHFMKEATMTGVSAVKKIIFIPFENGVRKFVVDAAESIKKPPMTKAQEKALLEELTTSPADTFTKVNEVIIHAVQPKVKSPLVQKVIGETYLPYEGGIRTQEVTRNVLAPEDFVRYQAEGRILNIKV
ncbi:MAG TPA: hypothetical protein PLG15_05160 [Candidatus Gastranaerophilaceae bacterium]|mgnify:CR=1 FL=1|nr:hypothetical protein [Candidatus Gastranaerophilaceae bacterium]HPT41753.1 hypothetical protein [Candidatus Gastranaerophilaceae bacterium]